ncbi:hypothetical protein AB8O38_01075 [Saccharomonospora xinjiangensis]|uniref:hypothetical protein n=1 Tax=Saccharomonospora xinjiangensis TaxID=75294 RepID=UPI00350F2E3E
MTQPHQVPNSGQWPYPAQQWQQSQQWQQPPAPGYGYPGPSGYPGYPGHPFAPQPQKPSGLSFAGMILGLVAIAFLLLALIVPLLGFVSLPAAVVGIVLSSVGGAQDNRSGVGHGMATAGVICSFLPLLLFFIGLVFWFRW